MPHLIALMCDSLTRTTGYTFIEKKKSQNIHLFHLKTIHIKFMHNDHQKFFQKLLAIGLLLQLMDYVLLKVTLKYYKINTNYRAITKFQKRA